MSNPNSSAPAEEYFQIGPSEQRSCEKHGAFEARSTRLGTRIVWSQCEGCEADRLRQERESLRRERRAAAAAQQLELSGIPLRHCGKGFGGFVAGSAQQSAARDLVQRYSEALIARTEQRGAGLLLVGPPGTGKTHLAVACGEALAAACESVRYTTCTELTRRLRATYSRGADESEGDVYRDLTEARLLILDELAAATPSDHERRQLFELVDARYRELQPTIFVSNLPLKELAPVIGERVVDRLREMTTTIAFAWQSHRGKVRDIAA